MNNDSFKKTVLAVDDVPANIDVIKGILSPDYVVQAATNGTMALKIIENKKPDLILLDVMMPDIDGYEVCEIIKANRELEDIPVIFLTAKTDMQDEAKGLLLGAVDYIIKPVIPVILKTRVKTHLELKAAKDSLNRQNEILEEKVIQRTQQMEELQDVVMVAMGSLAEARDPETGNHIRRTQWYVHLLASSLKYHPKFRNFLTPETITFLYKSAPMHDIGKVAIPDHILLKTGKLTSEEFELMKQHAKYGRDAIASAIKKIEKSDNFLGIAQEIAYTHHEKWDGSGYPEGLCGEGIPISGRLMALADVYDALISKRCYKSAFTHEKAVSIIEEGRATHFDPDITDTFLQINERFFAVAQEFADKEE